MTPIGIALRNPERTKLQYTPDEVTHQLMITQEQIRDLNQVIEILMDRAQGNVPEMIKLITEYDKITPIERSYLIYTMGYAMVEKAFKNAIPDMIKEALNAGAQMALNQFRDERGDQDQQDQPVINTGSPETDPMYR